VGRAEEDTMMSVKMGPRVVRRTADDNDRAPYERIQLRPLGPIIGAEVEGVDLTRPIPAAVREELHRALLEWKVLFLRDQHVTGEQHRRFARLWGELEVHPFLPAGEVPEVVRFEKGDRTKGYENVWHSDVSWRRLPSMASVLRAVEVPELGGDTLWCDMGAAYDGLGDGLRARIDGLVAVHDFVASFGRGMPADKLAEMRAEYPPATHPVVRTHPETGRRTLYVNRIFTSHIVGLEPDDSDELLDRLCRQADVPEYQIRFRWQPDSIAWWDNRATQHYAVSDYWPQRRVMERATIIGDQPF
jgi:taurine dioxygenase